MLIPGLNNVVEPQERHEYSLWMLRDGHVYADCIACGRTAYCEPSEYCPHCGAAMLNIVDARRDYRKEDGQHE